MTDHNPLDRDRHRDLRIRTGASASFGDAVMACLTVPSEFRRVQNQFPILFRRDLERDRFSALALFGFENGENLFLDDSGWTASYRPLALAVQPFLVGPAPAEGQTAVHVDLSSPRIAGPDEEGVRAFGSDGQPTPYLEAVAAALDELDIGYRDSQGFFDALERYELLEPFSLDVELENGAQHRLVGYHIVDEDKLRALEPGAVADLHSGGHLMPIFMALASLANLPELVRRKNRLLADG